MPFPRHSLPLLWGPALLLIAASPAQAGWKDAKTAELSLDSSVPLTLRLERVVGSPSVVVGLSLPLDLEDDPIVVALEPARPLPWARKPDPAACSEVPFQGDVRIRLLADLPGDAPGAEVDFTLLDKKEEVLGLTWVCQEDGGTSWKVRKDVPNRASLTAYGDQASVYWRPKRVLTKSWWMPDKQTGMSQSTLASDGDKPAGTGNQEAPRSSAGDTKAGPPPGIPAVPQAAGAGRSVPEPAPDSKRDVPSPAMPREVVLEGGGLLNLSARRRWRITPGAPGTEIVLNDLALPDPREVVLGKDDRCVLRVSERHYLETAGGSFILEPVGGTERAELSVVLSPEQPRGGLVLSRYRDAQGREQASVSGLSLEGTPFGRTPAGLGIFDPERPAERKASVPDGKGSSQDAKGPKSAKPAVTSKQTNKQKAKVPDAAKPGAKVPDVAKPGAKAQEAVKPEAGPSRRQRDRAKVRAKQADKRQKAALKQQAAQEQARLQAAARRAAATPAPQAAPAMVRVAPGGPEVPLDPSGN